MSFWKELSRRNVVKVGIAYAVAAWLIIHPVDIIFPILHLPEWSITLVTAFLIILFPLVLIFSWVYEVTPKGLKKTKEVPLAKSTTYVTGRKLNYMIIGLLVVAVGLLIFDNFYLDRQVINFEQVPTVSDVEKVKKTIAVLPFEDLSPESDQRYFVDGLSEEILNSLCQIPDLNVTGRTSSFSFKGSNKTTQEVAGVLGVENILEGSVRKAGNSLRITAQLLRGKDGFHLWSKTYDRELKDIFAVQEDIATVVANELKATLGIGKSVKKLGGTDNEKAYELYLIATGIWRENSEYAATAYNRAVESLDSALALDPKFVLAWAAKANNHVCLAIFGPANRAMEEQNTALYAAKKAIELEPNLADGYFALGFIKMSKSDWIDAGLAFHKSLELRTKSLSGSEAATIVVFYHTVGYFKAAQPLLEEIRRNDPFDQAARGHYIVNYGFIGDKEGAEAENKICRTLFGKQWNMGNIITWIRIGSIDHISRDQIVSTDPIFEAIKNQFESPREALEEIHRIYSKAENLSSADFTDIFKWAAYFGDTDLAIDAMGKAVKIDGSGFFDMWYPAFRKVRQTPRFKKFVRDIGLVDYWNKFGWPDICHQLDNGDFECD